MNFGKIAPLVQMKVQKKSGLVPQSNGGYALTSVNVTLVLFLCASNTSTMRHGTPELQTAIIKHTFYLAHSVKSTSGSSSIPNMFVKSTSGSVFN